MQLKVLIDDGLLDGQPFTTVNSPNDIVSLERMDTNLSGRLSIDPDDLAIYQAEETRKTIRHGIENDVADMSSLLGTTSDGAALCLAKLAELAASLSTATTLAEVRAAAQPLATLTADFLSKVQDGTIQLPHMVKGGDAAALTEIGDRLTGVAAVITQNSGE